MLMPLFPFFATFSTGVSVVAAVIPVIRFERRSNRDAVAIGLHFDRICDVEPTGAVEAVCSEGGRKSLRQKGEERIGGSGVGGGTLLRERHIELQPRRRVVEQISTVHSSAGRCIGNRSLINTDPVRIDFVDIWFVVIEHHRIAHRHQCNRGSLVGSSL